ncbi:hypothetical protein F5X98DRAFT_389256 [Xylaria grammica]|nr:hypothetical protein F5X98DRAFT_389256 [Xylaria grammica]
MQLGRGHAQEDPGKAQASDHEDSNMWYDASMWVPAKQVYQENEALHQASTSNTTNQHTQNTSAGDPGPSSSRPKQTPAAPDPRAKKFSWTPTFTDGANSNANLDSEQLEVALATELSILQDVVTLRREQRNEGGGIWDGTRPIEEIQGEADRARAREEKLEAHYRRLDELVGVRLGSTWGLCAYPRLHGLCEKVRLIRDIRTTQRHIDESTRELEERQGGPWWRIQPLRNRGIKKRRKGLCAQIHRLQQALRWHDRWLRSTLVV